MNILLDTHILLWSLTGDSQLTQRATDIISDEKNTITMVLGVKTGKKDIKFVDLVCNFPYYFDILVHTNYFNGIV